MDRETRKANLKKLQLPITAGKKERRKTCQSARPTARTNPPITNYVLTSEKHVEPASGTEISPVAFKHNDDIPQSSDIYLKSGRTRAGRTKLDAFIFKDPNKIPDSIKKTRKFLNDDDIIVPEKKAKKAPKLTRTGSQTKSSKTSRAKKQTTIKSAFLRNEQLFAEIAAQHCAAEQFDGDDIQLALAISKSEAESKGIRVVNENVIEDEVNFVDDESQAESIREKLKKYGFRTAEKKDYNTFAAAFLPKINSRRPKSKWANKFTALTLRSSEVQFKKLQENIDKLLNNQLRTKSLHTHAKGVSPHYKLQSPLLKKLEMHANQRLFQSGEILNQPNEFYFVTDLFEVSKLPAGHLLKDWTAIQGRDSTPNSKNKQTPESLKILEQIYKDLEEYLSSRKRLDWTQSSVNKADEKVSTKEIVTKNERQKAGSPAIVTLHSNSPEIVETAGNVELDEMVNLIEGLERIEEAAKETTLTDFSDSTCDHNILQLLPTCKSLDVMQVSSCSYNTPTTITTTQKHKSTSPDLFADSDVDMEEIEKVVEDTTKDKTLINDATYNLEANIITYEIFSSDEVKKTSLPDLNESIAKETSPIISLHASYGEAIDLTEDNYPHSTNFKSRDNFNQSKVIVEIDLFAESPPHEEDNERANISRDSQTSKYTLESSNEDFQFTLNMETNDHEKQNVKKKTEESLKLLPGLENQERLEIFTSHKDDDEMAMNTSNKSFLNFQDSKQLQTGLDTKTVITEKDNIKDELMGNDAKFRELCNKYLKYDPDNISTVRTKRKNGFGKSFSQMLPKASNNFTNFNMDFNMTVDNNITLRRKSLSFTAKTPLKMNTNDTSTVLVKSKSFNNNELNANIDLTQSDAEDDVDIADEEDDDCVLLSDDEINYSIWQANKTLNFQYSEQSDSQDDLDDAVNEKHLLSSKKSIIEFPEQHNKEFSYLDLEGRDKSVIKVALGAEDSLTDFQILTSKYAPPQDELQFERSEFGILEECSEPMDSTPNLCTPTKALTEVSFLTSPSETTAPMKRYSSYHSYSQKFQNLINNIETKSSPKALDNFDVFDEFDQFVYTSPLKSAAKSNKKPQDLDVLLTGEISFKESAKTPETTRLPSKSLSTTEQVIECNNKIYTVRYTCSPKPDYTKYTEAELLKELYNFGIKPLKRKQAVKILEYIYNQTHPILMEEEEDTDENEEDDVIILEEFERPSTSKEALKAKNLISQPDSIAFRDRNGSKKEEAVDFVESANKKINLQDSCGLEMLRYSTDLKAELPNEKYILQTNVTKKTPQPLLPFHIAWYNLVCSNQKLHETILLYQPIDLQEIFLFLKSLGYRYDPKDLKTFFDSRCIIFRYDVTSAAGGNGKTKDKNRHVRKSKKTKVNYN